MEMAKNRDIKKRINCIMLISTGEMKNAEEYQPKID